jgi:hypothetical protein
MGMTVFADCDSFFPFGHSVKLFDAVVGPSLDRDLKAV